MARSWSKEAHGFGRPHEVWQGDLTQGRPGIDLLRTPTARFLNCVSTKASQANRLRSGCISPVPAFPPA